MIMRRYNDHGGGLMNPMQVLGQTSKKSTHASIFSVIFHEIAIQYRKLGMFFKYVNFYIFLLLVIDRVVYREVIIEIIM